MNKASQKIQVFARCRPLNAIEKKQCSPQIVDVIPDKKIVVKDKNIEKNREFTFDRVFPPNANQISVYKAVVEPLIQEVLQGYNCTVFAYGQTGTGKTYTMEGERNDSKCSWEDDPGAGIIPRSLHQLFEDLNKEENVEFSVRVSFLELYNEELFDLLSTDLSKMRLYEDSSKKGSVIVQGLEEIIVNTKDEVYAILERGTAKRQTAATLLNATSSRSHTVFSVIVHIKENTIEGEELLKTGKLNLVDLAGSENVGRSGAVDKRAREAGNINQSLLTLGRVITALTEKQPHVPYRESKLTRLLQDSLGGHTKTSIIATISPALCNFDETISTLDYANKAKSITIRPEANQKMTKRALIREYTEEIERLRKDLEAQRKKEGVIYVDPENHANDERDRRDKEQMIKDLAEKLEAVKEENAKIEEMLFFTKEQLTVTSEKLDQTKKQYEKTSVELRNVKCALDTTKQVLSETSLDRDEKQYLINVQQKTEKKLSQQAQRLLSVADETSSDTEKLHDKIDRKAVVEKTNEERCQEFRAMFQKRCLELDEFVSAADEKQSTKLNSIESLLDNIADSLQSFKRKNNQYLSSFVAEIESAHRNIILEVTDGYLSLDNSTNALIDKSSVQKDLLQQKLNEFSNEKLPELVKSMSARLSELEDWVFGVLNEMTKRVKNLEATITKHSTERKSLFHSFEDSFESWLENFKACIQENDAQQLTHAEEQRKLDEELLAFTKSILLKKEKLLENSLERNSAVISNKISSMPEVKKFVASAEDCEVAHCQTCIDDLNDLLPLIDIEQLSEKKENVSSGQNNLVLSVQSYLSEHNELQEKQFLERENLMKCNISSISENLKSSGENVSAVDLSFKNSVAAVEGSNNVQLEVLENVIDSANGEIKSFRELISSASKELKNEIFHRDLELEKFFTEDLLRDVPTGTTPQRKVYLYPRDLAATSPHDRILQRLRAQLAETDVAANLPLNSSFDEKDEIASRPELSEVVESYEPESTELKLSTSTSSDDSTDTGSCASSMSDLSVDSEKNKENTRLKKGSRVPKKLPSSKIFLKPAPLSSRKPLMSSNNAEM